MTTQPTLYELELSNGTDRGAGYERTRNFKPSEHVPGNNYPGIESQSCCVCQTVPGKAPASLASGCQCLGCGK